MLTNEHNSREMLWGNVNHRTSGDMAAPVSAELRYRSEALWPIRKMIFLVSGVSLAVWIAVFVAVL